MISDDDFTNIIHNAQDLTREIRLVRTSKEFDKQKLEIQTLRAVTDIWELIELVTIMRQHVKDANTMVSHLKKHDI